MKNSGKLCFLFFLLAFLFGCKTDNNSQPIKVLLLSGSNNHDWKNTSPFLGRIYSGSELFEVKLTEKPDTLKTQDLQDFDVIVSNWNSWPENDIRWSADLESAILEFVDSGGGLVTFHASTSVFYKWPDFKNISTSAWVDSTWHGENSRMQVIIQNNNHPTTKGLNSFFIFDELWINAEENPSFTILGSATNEDISEKEIENQPAIFVKEYGKGRVFHTILGHDVRTMRNTGFQTLMLRGTEWAASGKVSQKIPQELVSEKISANNFSWAKSDSTFTLMNGEKIVWQYNFYEKHGKPFFHPVYLGKNNMTCLSPDDHPWHVGQWFSWKFINGVNYWEYQNDTYQSEGMTKIIKVQLIPKDDFSAEIHLDIVYHPKNGENVLAEKRMIKVSPPNKDETITMNYTFDFEALADSVDLNRTPILGEPDGMSWGGYAGLSIRFNQDFMEPKFISGWGENENINGKSGGWLYMGFKGMDENEVGTQIMISADTQREGSSWYSVNTEDHPFYYFSPALIYQKPLLLLKNEQLKLQYKVKHYVGEKQFSELEKEFNQYQLNQ